MTNISFDSFLNSSGKQGAWRLWHTLLNMFVTADEL